MPWTTTAVVFGSWALLLILTLLHYRAGKRRRKGDRQERDW